MNEFEVVDLWARPLYVSSIEIDEDIVNACVDRQFRRNGPELGLISTIEGVNQTTVDQNILEERVFADLHRQIEMHVGRYINDVYQRDDKFEIVNSWINIHENGDSAPRHCHARSDISGVLYIVNQDDMGGIIFQDNVLFGNWYGATVTNRKNKYNQSSVYGNVCSGDLILFPSFIEHSTDVNNSESRRISLAFDIKFI